MARATSQAASIDRERAVIFYCRVGGRSQMAAQALRTAGYEAYSMTGGLVRWASEGRPLSPQGGKVADH
jgi:rhodanese-related sulfurtransferase